MMHVYIRVFLLVIVLSACVSTETTRPRDDTVMHIVLIWLNEAGNQKHMQQVIEVSRQLEEIPELQEFRIGKSILSNRKIVDDSFDIGIYMTFANQNDLATYLKHDKHKEVVTTVLKPLTKKIVVYDISISDS